MSRHTWLYQCPECRKVTESPIPWDVDYIKDWMCPECCKVSSPPKWLQGHNPIKVADPVHHPAHYRHLPKEAIDIIHHVLGDDGFIAYCNGTILKYRLRVGHKDEVQQEMGKIREYERFRRNVEQGRGPREDD